MRTPELAIALDLKSATAALALVDELGSDVAWYKVGSVLGVAEGPVMVRELVGRGKSVFLDYKWHDIPNTVSGAVAAAASMGVSLATVHLAGGRGMLEAAAEARGSLLRLVGVGVLTSHDASSYGAVVGREALDLGHEQKRLMEPALDLLDGFVAAPSEVEQVRRLAGENAFLVAPGIRLAGDDPGDQVRIASPADAVRAGADLLVVGRPVTAARNPAEVVRAIRVDMAGAAAVR